MVHLKEGINYRADAKAIKNDICFSFLIQIEVLHGKLNLHDKELKREETVFAGTKWYLITKTIIFFNSDKKGLSNIVLMNLISFSKINRNSYQVDSKTVGFLDGGYFCRESVWSSLRISKRTYLMSIKLYVIVKQSS